MPPMPEPAFRRRLHGLAPRQFVAFVAAIWRARGAEVTVSEQTLEVRHRGTAETVCPVQAPRWGSLAGAVPPEADVVVTDAVDPGSVPAGTRVVDAAALYELAAYGIDRDEADDICQEFLGRPLTGGGADGGRSVPARAVLAVAALAGLAVLAVAVPVPQDGGGRVAPVAGGATDGPTTRTFGTPVEELPYTQMWPGYERAPAGPGAGCFTPAVEQLPYTEMRPNHDGPATTDATTTTATGSRERCRRPA
ncbi:MAG: hypothetical protein ABEH77_01155 [Halobacteriaceae archaeon]